MRTRSKRPKTSPNATHVDVVGKILHLRQNYHFGPEKIAMYLKRYHDITISKSGVWRILKRLNMSRLPASQRYQRHDKRWKRYEKQRPGHHVQIDVKFIEPVAGVTGQRGGRRRARIDALGAGGGRVGRRRWPRRSSSTPGTYSWPPANLQPLGRQVIVGSVVAHHNGRVSVSIGADSRVFDVPPDKDIDLPTMIDLRWMLTAAGYSGEA